MPHWSADGEWIVFDGNEGSGWDLYLVRPDGSDVTRLTENPLTSANASWSPDGTRLVHRCTIGEFTTLCMVDVRTRLSQPLFKP